MGAANDVPLHEAQPWKSSASAPSTSGSAPLNWKKVLTTSTPSVHAATQVVVGEGRGVAVLVQGANPDHLGEDGRVGRRGIVAGRRRDDCVGTVEVGDGRKSGLRDE